MEKITMSKREIEQIKIFERVKNKEITKKEAGIMLDMTPQWIRKKYKRYQEKGEIGLLHGNRGKLSLRRTENEIEVRIEKIVLDGLVDAGPTFIAYEYEKRHGIKISKETVRKLMIRKGLWQGKIKRSVHRKRRERRSNFGWLTQIDGSFHLWFEDRGKKCVLIVFIDDATSKILWLEFAESESTESLMISTKSYVKKLGRPRECYTDFGSVFSVNVNNKDREKKTQYHRSLEDLDITLIHAHSPQAKGRVERVNRTLQDRLVKALRLKNISTITEANYYVQNFYIHEHNELFAQEPEQQADVHLPIDGYDLDSIFSIKEKRIIQNDFIVSYKNNLFQLHKQQKITVRPKDSIEIRISLDGIFSLFLRGVKLAFTELKKRPQKQPKEKIIIDKLPYKPASNHPWRTYAQPLK
jgi:hypothetical protein